MEDFEKTQNGEPSQEMCALIENPERLKLLLEGGRVHSDDEPFDTEESWKKWVRGRRFIASAIDKGGSFLDFGSANGLLLKSI